MEEGENGSPCRYRRSGSGAQDKRIGSSLEAAPVVHVADADLAAALDGLDFAEICITSDISVVAGEGPAEAFRLDDGTKVAVEPKLAEGTKCARSWRITKDVGSDPDYPDVSARDAQALRELAAASERRCDAPDDCALPRHPVSLPEIGRNFRPIEVLSILARQDGARLEGLV